MQRTLATFSSQCLSLSLLAVALLAVSRPSSFGDPSPSSSSSNDEDYDSSSFDTDDDEATRRIASRIRQNFQKIDLLIRNVMSCRWVPGLVVSVVHRKRTVFRKSFGWSNIAESRPMTSDTRLCIASCTKAFTSILLGKLLQKTRYDWDTPINNILRQRIEFDDVYVKDHVTSRDLLLHRTGVFLTYDILWLSTAISRTNIVERIKHMPTTNRFRTEARYNNIIYSLAGFVTEQIGTDLQGSDVRTDQNDYVWSRPPVTWEGLMRDLILRPLDMYNTSFYHDRRGSPPGQFGLSYVIEEGVDGFFTTTPLGTQLLTGVDSIASAVSVCSTLSDMGLWMKALLRALRDDVTENSDPVLPSHIVQQTMESQVLAKHMFASRIPPDKAMFITDGYGLGWFTGYYRGKELSLLATLEGLRIVMHYGSLNSYSLLTIVPDRQLAVFSHFNGARQNDPYTINVLLHSYLIDIALGFQPWMTYADVCTSKSFPLNATAAGTSNSSLKETALAKSVLQKLLRVADGREEAEFLLEAEEEDPEEMGEWETELPEAEIQPTVNKSIETTIRNNTKQVHKSLNSQRNKTDSFERVEKVSLPASDTNPLQYESYEGVFDHDVLGRVTIHKTIGPLDEHILTLLYGRIRCRLSRLNGSDEFLQAVPLEDDWRLLLGGSFIVGFSHRGDNDCRSVKNRGNKDESNFRCSDHSNQAGESRAFSQLDMLIMEQNYTVSFKRATVHDNLAKHDLELEKQPHKFSSFLPSSSASVWHCSSRYIFRFLGLRLVCLIF